MPKRKPWRKTVWLNATVLGAFVLLLIVLVTAVNLRGEEGPLAPELMAQYHACEEQFGDYQLEPAGPLTMLAEQLPPPPKPVTTTDDQGVEVLALPEKGSYSDNLGVMIPSHHPRFLEWLAQAQPVVHELRETLEQPLPCVRYDYMGKRRFEHLLLAYGFLGDEIPGMERPGGLYLVDRYRFSRAGARPYRMRSGMRRLWYSSDSLQPLQEYALWERDPAALQETYEALAAAGPPYADLEDALLLAWHGVDLSMLRMSEDTSIAMMIASFRWMREQRKEVKQIRKQRPALLAAARAAEESLTVPSGAAEQWLSGPVLTNLSYHATLLHFQLQIAALVSGAPVKELSDTFLSRLPERTQTLVKQGRLRLLNEDTAAAEGLEPPPGPPVNGDAEAQPGVAGPYVIAANVQAASDSDVMLLHTTTLAAALAHREELNRQEVYGPPAANVAGL